MPYEAVSAYTVLIGETGKATTVTVHGSADEAWRALAEAVRSRSTRWMPRSGEPASLADRWRLGAPERRFWQVSAHQLQVMVPATGEPPSRAPTPSAAPTETGRPRSWRRSWRRPTPHSAG
ncbi:MAG TPA: hypothetical protein VFQ77_11385 [Pseudonocardiaceae bacterium]|nr:hypothetical protein [Pseudonocardiaceae bacterium]